jgi:uncharacterized protein (DUF362 family)
VVGFRAFADSADGILLADCRELLAEYRVRFAGRPVDEHRQLCMLALEREQIVSFAYRDQIIGKRLDQINAPTTTIELLRHALVQVWRDEEAHTVLVRGKLLADRHARRTARVIVEQAAGLLSGWSAALRHHVPRSRAPMRNWLVDALSLGAVVVGKLSPELRAELTYKSFGDYCTYNVDAEETAELCWRRLVELDDELGYGNRVTFERIAREEREHREVFALIAACLDDHDRLHSEWTDERIDNALVLIGERFAIRTPERNEAVNRVHVIEGNSKFVAADELLTREPLAVEGKSVAIKASWMMGYSRRDPSSITDPGLLEHLVSQLRQAGATTISLLDGPNVYSELFDGREVEQVARHFGIGWPHAPALDTNADVTALKTSTLFGPERINRQWVEADVRIVITRLRSHPTEHAHLSVANLEGLIDDSCRNIFWNRSYDYSAAAVSAMLEAPPTLAIVDAWNDCPDGWFGIMAGPNPKHPRRLYGGRNALTVDLVLLSHTGSPQRIDSPTLRRVTETFGDPRPITVVGRDEPIDGWHNPYQNRFTGFVADISYPIYGWLSRGGALFAPPMDAVFTERKRLPVMLRLARRCMNRILAVAPPRA